MPPEFIILPALFATFGWIFWVMFTSVSRVKSSKIRAGVQTALVEKLGSSQELLTYVQSDAGKRLIESLGIERTQPHGRIIGALQTGVVLLPVGIGLLVLRGHVAGTQEGFLLFGTLICALGIGFVLAAGVAYILTKSFGLLEPTASQHNS